MSSSNSPQRITLGQFADRFRGEMVPLGNRFSYFCAAVTLSEDDLREYLEEPIAALPQKLACLLPNIQILLVPYLERANGVRDVVVAVEKPNETRTTYSGAVISANETLLAFAIKDTEVADYHYRFYRALADLLPGKIDREQYEKFASLLREELSANIHGEVDEPSWRAKQSLLRRSEKRRDAKALAQYVRASFVDVMTLYMHGICCDIDVETGPRQLPSRYLRTRLKLLRDMYPPPSGYAVLPEELPPA